MNKKANKLVPKLRFPEFRESEEWEKRTIGQISDSVTAGGTPSTSEKAYWNGSIRWMNSGELNYKKVYEVQGRITGEGLRNSSTKIIPKMCVLIGLAGQGKTRGTVAMNMVELCINQSIAAIFPNEKKYSSDFLYHNLDNRYDELRSLSAGGEGRGGLNLQIIKSMGVPLPHIIEQQKIADCLSSIDDLINAQSQKVEALKTHKKGLMQQLFPREGETVPRLRFPEFLGAGEWVPQRIEGLAKRGSGHTPDKKQASYYNGGIKWASLADSNMLDNGFLYSTKNEISKDGLKNSSAVLHPAGTVILSRDAGVGKSAVLYSEMAVSQHFMAWVCDDSKLSNWFLYYVLQILKPTFESIAVGSTIKTIGLPYFKSLYITIPCVKEQQKIADCLSIIDELITVQTQKLETLKTHKKGLMQQLFPMASEEV